MCMYMAIIMLLLRCFTVLFLVNVLNIEVYILIIDNRKQEENLDQV